MEKKFKQDKGVAGLTILLSLIVMIFVIGLLVMIFSLMGTSLKDTTYTSTSGTVTNETGVWLNQTGYTVDGAGTRNERNYVLTAVWNRSASLNYNVTVPLTNASLTTAGVIKNGTVTTYANVSITYTYNYEADNTATDVMNDTINSVATTTDWFDIFIVIGAMVVLILLTVIIITSIKGSGLIAGAGSTGNSVGTA